MFLHLIIAAALLSPGTTIAGSVAPAAAMVCRIAAEIRSTTPHERHAADAAARRTALIPFVAPAYRENRLTTQLRR
jgi:hypothetical protein